MCQAWAALNTRPWPPTLSHQSQMGDVHTQIYMCVCVCVCVCVFVVCVLICVCLTISLSFSADYSWTPDLSLGIGLKSEIMWQVSLQTTYWWSDWGKGGRTRERLFEDMNSWSPYQPFGSEATDSIFMTILRPKHWQGWGLCFISNSFFDDSSGPFGQNVMMVKNICIYIKNKSPAENS